MKLEFSRQIFEKWLNCKFHENPSCGSGLFPCGRADRHDEATSSFSQLRKRLKNQVTSQKHQTLVTGTREGAANESILRCSEMCDRVDWYRCQYFWDTCCWNLQGTVVLAVVLRLKHKIITQLQHLSTEEQMTSQQGVPAALIAVVT